MRENAVTHFALSNIHFPVFAWDQALELLCASTHYSLAASNASAE